MRKRVKKRKTLKKGTYINQAGQRLDLPDHDGSIGVPKEYSTTNL